MSDAALGPGIEQAFYGSFSGHHDFRIMAASAGLSRDEREAILYHSNLGGSALTAEDPGPIYAFYELDRRRKRWAFSRTVFLGRERRGNDYLAHVLVLGSEALGLLRGNPFLLEDLGLLSRDKPREESVLPALFLDPGESERLSRQELKAGVSASGFSRERLTGILRGLSLGSVALQVENARAGEVLCRSVLSLLPPADRMRTSFCSRFTLPRFTAFNLASFVQEDASLAERYLAGFDPRSSELAPTGSRDPFEAWMTEVGRGADPLFGISLLERPDEALRILKGLRSWLAWIDERIGPSPAEEAQRSNLPILAVADDGRNQRLERVGRLRVDSALEQVNRRVELALQGAERPLASLAEACALVKQRDPEGKTVDRILEDARRGLSEKTPRSLEEVTVVVVLALLGSERAQLDRIYNPAGGRAVLRNREEASGWLLALHRASPLACLELTTAWLTHWRLAEGSDILAEVALLLSSLTRISNESAVAEAVRTGVAALEAAAPPAGQQRERTDWFLGLLTTVRPHLKELFSAPLAARLALQEELLPQIPSGDREELVPLLASVFSQWLADRMKKDPISDIVLPILLRSCRDGLLGKPVGGRMWNPYREPALWELVGQVASQAASAAQRDLLILEDLAWMLWAASRLLSKVRKGGSNETNRLLIEALDIVIKICPEGIMDIVLRVVYRLALCGWDLDFTADRPALDRFRRQAWQDGRNRSLNPGFFHGTLMRMAALDNRLFATGLTALERK